MGTGELGNWGTGELGNWGTGELGNWGIRLKFITYSLSVVLILLI